MRDLKEKYFVTSEDSYDKVLKYLRNAIGNQIDDERIDFFHIMDLR